MISTMTQITGSSSPRSKKRRELVQRIDMVNYFLTGIVEEGGLYVMELVMFAQRARRALTAFRLALAAFLVVFSTSQVLADAGFQRCVAEFRQVALQNGI